jgi:methylenetetrahydrofolate dehydrogenase (NADP+)/methenyltetrahydrofolate cyclohydrolase
MSAQIIDGKQTADTLLQKLEGEIRQLKQQDWTPGLSVILVGDDPASISYVGRKQKACEKIGIHSETIHLPAETSEQELLALLKKLNADPSVHGILVQLPLPKQISPLKVIETIIPEKDVDGLHPVNKGKLVAGEDCFWPCTPAGIQQLLLHYGFSPEGKHVVVVGRSGLVGMPFALMMMQKAKGANATVTVCHTGTTDLKKHTLLADILVVAAGRANTITAEMVRPGSVVIDVGTNRVDDPASPKGYRLIGDVDFESVKEVAGAITPVPGGVGPMTIAMLLYNTVKAAKAFQKKASAAKTT